MFIERVSMNDDGRQGTLTVTLKYDNEKRPARTKLSAAESLKRMQDIDKRKEAMIAAVRKGKNRSVFA